VTCLICGKKFNVISSECKCGAREFDNWLQQRTIFSKGNGHTPESRLSQSTASIEKSQSRSVLLAH
jgi:hypothetical protein